MNTVDLLITENTFTNGSFASVLWIGLEIGGDPKQRYLPDRKVEGEWAKELSVGDKCRMEVTFDNGTFKYVAPLPTGREGRVVEIIPDVEEELEMFEARYGKIKRPSLGHKVVTKKVKDMATKNVALVDELKDNFHTLTRYWEFVANDIATKAYKRETSDRSDKDALKKQVEYLRQSGAHHTIVDEMQATLDDIETKISKQDGGKRQIIAMSKKYIATPSVSSEIEFVIDHSGVMENLSSVTSKSVPVLLWVYSQMEAGDDQAKGMDAVYAKIDEIVTNPGNRAHS